MKFRALIILVTCLVLFLGAWFAMQRPAEQIKVSRPVDVPSSVATSPKDGTDAIPVQATTTESVTKSKPFGYPLIGTTNREVKKFFGIHVSPQSSPVSPERFSGYHTGFDFEMNRDEMDASVLVTAICSGEAVYRQWVKGYGGVLVQSCMLDGKTVTVLYGHLSLKTIISTKGDRIEQGSVIGMLGKGYSQETDDERKHLHISIHRGNRVELRGYTSEQSMLDQWVDPSTVIDSEVE